MVKLLPLLVVSLLLSLSFSAHGATTKHQLGEDIRWVFVSFLFALVIAEIAQRFSKIFIGWNKVKARGPKLLHLVFASIVVMLSWVGWSLAVIYGAYPEPTAIFELPTLFVFLDVALLISYYSLALGIDVCSQENPELPSIRHVLLWTVIIFAGYLLWDVLVAHLRHDFLEYKWWPSACCLVLATIAFAFLGKAKAKPHDPWLVYYVDGALISLFVAFRAMKGFKPWSRDTWNDFALMSAILVLMFIVLLGLARHRKVD